MLSLEFLKRQTYKQTIRLINQVCQRSGVDQTHGLPHAVQIASHVKKALDSIPLENKPSQQTIQNVLLAALLHDVDDHKYFKSSNFENAKQILCKVMEDKQRCQQIIRMIDLVSFSKNGNTIYSIDPIQSYFPRYADRIQAIGLIGLYRTFQYSIRVQNPFYTQQTPRPSSREQLQEIMKGRDSSYIKRGGTSVSVIDHAFDKLLHIRLPCQIKNPYLDSLYQAGHHYMVQFVLANAKNGYVDAQQDLCDRFQQMIRQKDTKLVNELL